MPVLLVYRDMETTKESLTVCSRGHEFFKSAEQPVCPVCWPGHYEKKKKEDAPQK